MEYREPVSSPSTPPDQSGSVLRRVVSYPNPLGGGSLPNPWDGGGGEGFLERVGVGSVSAHLQSCSQGFFRADVGEDQGGVMGSQTCSGDFHRPHNFLQGAPHWWMRLSIMG